MAWFRAQSFVYPTKGEGRGQRKIIHQKHCDIGRLSKCNWDNKDSVQINWRKCSLHYNNQQHPRIERQLIGHQIYFSSVIKLLT